MWFLASVSRDKYVTCKFEKADTDKRTIEGLSTTFGNKDLDGDIIESFAWDGQIESNPTLKVKGLWQHQSFTPLGNVTHEKVAQGLFARYRLSEGVAKGNEALALADDGVIDSFSIGFRVIEEHFDQERRANIITRAELREVSLVTFPANPLARISDIKNAKDKADMKSRIIEALRNGVGLSIKDAERFCATGFASLGNLDGDADDGKEKFKQALIKQLLAQ